MNTYQPTSSIEYAQRLHNQRQRKGINRADHEYVTGFLEAWLTLIDQPERLDRYQRIDTYNRVAAGMHETLAIRDALIIDAMQAHDEHSQLFAYASKPHDPRNVRHMYDALARLFNDPDADYDLDRLRHVSHTCQSMAEHQPTDYQAQPYAMAAYLEWFAGHDDEANRLATKALTLDKDTTLAAIVIAANLQNIHPHRFNR